MELNMQQSQINPSAESIPSSVPPVSLWEWSAYDDQASLWLRGAATLAPSGVFALHSE